MSFAQTKILIETILNVSFKQVVGEVKIEGGHRKPEWGDLFVVRLLLLPSILYKWAKRYHRINFLKQVTSYNVIKLTIKRSLFQELSREEKEELARDAVGMGTWDELSPLEKEELIETEVWRPEVRAQKVEEKDLLDSDDENGGLKPGFTKSARKIAKKKQ